FFPIVPPPPPTRLPYTTLFRSSTDTTPPSSSITVPASGSRVTVNLPVTISGSAADTGGGVVGAVEISLDGGSTWHPATGRENWVDRKSTRLNSSHGSISYAVFC